ncbi:hypothetical protein D3C87_1068360 [compost metagenome]
MAQAAFWLERVDKHLERNGLMREGLQHGAAGAGQHVVEAWIARQVATQHQGVEEATDQSFEALLQASGHGGPDHDIVLVAPARQLRGQHRLQGHEQRHIAFSGKFLERCKHAGRHLAGEQRAVVGLADRPWLVERQAVHLRHTLQLAPPVCGFRLQHLIGKRITLPIREIGILDGRGRELRRAAFGEGAVGLDKFGSQQVDRPTVGGNVVHVEHQHVAFGRQAKHVCTQHQVGGEVERRSGIGAQPALDFSSLGGRRQIRQVGQRQRHFAGGLHALERVSVAFGVRGTQHRMALDDRGQAVAARIQVEPAGQLEGGRHVVLGAGAFETVDQPQAMLRERQW